MQTPADGVAATTKYYTVALDTPNHSPAFLIGQDSDNSESWISRDSAKSVLNITGLTNRFEADSSNKSDSLRQLYSVFAYSIMVVISNGGFSTPLIIDQSHKGYTIDSVYALTKDSSIIFNLYNSTNPFTSENGLFTSDKAVTSKTGIYYYPDANQTISVGRYFMFQLDGALGEIDERLYLKIYYTLL